MTRETATQEALALVLVVLALIPEVPRARRPEGDPDEDTDIIRRPSAVPEKGRRRAKVG